MLTMNKSEMFKILRIQDKFEILRFGIFGFGILGLGKLYVSGNSSFQEIGKLGNWEFGIWDLGNGPVWENSIRENDFGKRYINLGKWHLGNCLTRLSMVTG
ncbi:hypothetical protein RCL_jg22447.t1 [Rhizophagus clarus]|uniref:Uncharacterized protein n=1 Tax=Rhizophagus clarus TaxID=94130 RepID=A0A8H3MCL6_9GLOM|nr:hypothetical protein RCL_jg22447.t1 [Rhizophagus clarus]